MIPEIEPALCLLFGLFFANVVALFVVFFEGRQMTFVFKPRKVGFQSARTARTARSEAITERTDLAA